MKYIIFENAVGLKFPIIFPLVLEHVQIARNIRGTPKSAGFCRFDENKVICYGESTSLNLHVDVADEDIINKEFNREG